MIGTRGLTVFFLNLFWNKMINQEKMINREKMIKSMKNMNKGTKNRIIGMIAVLLLPAVASAEMQLNGIVQDARTQKPIAAAQISVIDKSFSAVTDEKGQFVVTINSESDVLVVKAYDYASREVAVRGRKSLVIELFSDAFSDLNKQVSGLNGIIESSKLVSSIKGTENLGHTSALTVDEVIENTLLGDVRAINRSGTQGMGSSLFIRGINSLNANAQPLFVVDGVIWECNYDATTIQRGFFRNTLDNLDVNDIESVSVIKDGTSIYGSKGSNGVVLVKTKHSDSQVTKISLNTQWGYTEAPGSVPMMDGDDYRVYANDMFGSSGMSSQEVAAMDFLVTDPSSDAYNSYHNNTDWNDVVYQNGTNSNYLINVMGGDERGSVYFSLGYTNNTGVIKSTDMQRINVRFTADLTLMEPLKLGLNIGFTQSDRNMQDDGVGYYSSPTWLSKIKSSIMSPYQYSKSGGNLTTDLDDADVFGIGNPLAVINNSMNETKKFRFDMGLHPIYQINKDFNIGTQFDYNLLKSDERRFVPMNGTAPQWLEDQGYSYNEVNSMVARNTGLFDETRLTYKKNLENAGHLTAMYGFRYLYNYYEMDYAEEHNTGSDNKTTITGDYDYLQIDGINNETKSLSNFLQIDYDFDNRYFLTAGLSLDNSSRFGSEAGLALFPSVQGGWMVSSESFMKHFDSIGKFKIRAGYGVTGNDGISDYAATPFFTYSPFMKNAIGMVIGNLANKELQWERTIKTNAGIDLSLMNDRVNLTFDLFNSNTDQLLVQKEAPIYTGSTYYWTNSGTMNNKGYEGSANVKLLNTSFLKWELGATVGHYQNEITSLPEGEFTTTVYDGEVITREGEAAGSFYGYKALGVFSTMEDAATAYQTESGSYTYLKMKNDDGTYSNFNSGDIKFDDVNDDGLIDEKDKQVIGDPNPDFYGSITSTWKVGKLTFQALFTYCVGNDVYNYSRSLLEAGSDFSNQTLAMRTRWSGEGQITDVPRAVYGDPMGNARFSDRWIEDGSYLRFKTLTLSYELPMKKIFQGVNVWFSASNLFTATNYLGLDPEFSAGNGVYNQGVDAGLVPSTRSYCIGFKFNL
jgi:TonB-linked SusC/RagA family outer membrane protein